VLRLWEKFHSQVWSPTDTNGTGTHAQERKKLKKNLGMSKSWKHAHTFKVLLTAGTRTEERGSTQIKEQHAVRFKLLAHTTHCHADCHLNHSKQRSRLTTHYVLYRDLFSHWDTSNAEHNCVEISALQYNSVDTHTQLSWDIATAEQMCCDTHSWVMISVIIVNKFVKSTNRKTISNRCNIWNVG
jgi:hypothetical protein